MAQLPKGRARLRAVDPHYCKHPKLIPIWKYERFPSKVFYKCLVCGREMVRMEDYEEISRLSKFMNLDFHQI